MGHFLKGLSVAIPTIRGQCRNGGMSEWLLPPLIFFTFMEHILTIVQTNVLYRKQNERMLQQQEGNLLSGLLEQNSTSTERIVGMMFEVQYYSYPDIQ